MMRDAQALRLLAETFGNRSNLESGPARGLLEAMTYDHLKDLEAGVEATGRLLQPILGAAEHAPRVAGAAARWDLDLLRIFKDAEMLNGRLRKFFAGGEGKDDPARLMAEIQESIPAFESTVRAAVDRVRTAQLRRQP